MFFHRYQSQKNFKRGNPRGFRDKLAPTPLPAKIFSKSEGAPLLLYRAIYHKFLFSRGILKNKSNMTEFEVFLSHDHHDAKLVKRVHDILSKIGVPTYMYELYPVYRTTIPDKIRDTMKSCSICLVFLTSYGVQSLWVHQELGLAFGQNITIIPVVENGVDIKKKGFIELIPQINYNLHDFDSLAYSIIYALRTEILGHEERYSLKLRCPKGHERSDYKLPSTEDINACTGAQQMYVYDCPDCGSKIRVSPWTFEESP